MWGIAAAVVVILGLGTVALVAASQQVQADYTAQPRPDVTFTPKETAAPTPVFASPDGREIAVFFAGDSLTQGSYATSDALMFRNLVTAQVATVAPATASIVGKAGQTTQEAAQWAATAPTVADISVIEYGTNDVIRSTVEAFTTDYPAYLDRVRTVSPDSTLVCVGAWGAPEQTDPFDQIIMESCAAHAGIFVKVSDLFIDEGLRAMTGDTLPSGFVVPDNFHPNDTGHQAIADRITDALWN
jgi:lysophospholipase L1-like esterase